jgi:hypothetical protein
MVVWYRAEQYHLENMTFRVFENQKKNMPNKKVKIQKVYGGNEIEVCLKDLEDYDIVRNLNCLL